MAIKNDHKDNISTPASSKSTAQTPVSYVNTPETIGIIQERRRKALYPSRYLVDDIGWSNLTADQQTVCNLALILDSQSYLSWEPGTRKDFLNLCEKRKVLRPFPNSLPRTIEIDRKGRPLLNYTVDDFSEYKKTQETLQREKELSWLFRLKVTRSRRVNKGDRNELASESEINEEKHRRAKISAMETARKVGRYAGDPLWDDVTPIAQDDGENPLAAIAYTDEYIEVISYLRAIMANKEHSSRVLSLTEHIISLNPAHYTVWLYRASTLFALSRSIFEELDWVKEIALDNQKNYQIWHHRQVLVNALFPTLSTRSEILKLARSETAFMTEMFHDDAKNYHVWSYRQFLVRKLEIFPSQTEGVEDLDELQSIETLIERDVRNNSAWSHRFFLIFSDPRWSASDFEALGGESSIPIEIVDREITFSEMAIRKAPNNQSPWNYLRGVLKKAARDSASMEKFAAEFGGSDGNDVKSACALDFLADVYTAKGEKEKAATTLTLLAEKYDRIRHGYWQWRISNLKQA